MADGATQEPLAEAGQMSLQSLSSTASDAERPTIPSTFHRFAFLPEEIRRLIWKYACIPTRMQFLRFPRHCTAPRVGLLQDPADAPYLNHGGVGNDLAVLIANSANYTQQWSVPGCHKFRRFYWRRDLNGLSTVCPEAREIYLSLINDERSQLALKKKVHVNEHFDIFHFYSSILNKDETTFLLNMRPRLSPINLAIYVDVEDQDSNFYLVENGSKAVQNLPRWLLKAIEWGREAKEGYNNSPTTSLTPSIDDVMLNLQNLQAVFLIDHGIKLRRCTKPASNSTPSTGSNSKVKRVRTPSRPSAHQYNDLIHGMHCRFYALSPDNEEIMKHWKVPAHVWPVLEETKRVIGASDDWKVRIYLLASSSKKARWNSESE